jgi:tetratricopeptide (TPR) repeat protein
MLNTILKNRIVVKFYFKFSFFLLFLTSTVFSQSNNQSSGSNKELKDKIIEEHVHQCAKHYHYVFQMIAWQDCLDKGLEKDSTIAYLWQQKAMPYFKIQKYEVGMKYIDKAVLYNPQRYQPYRAFIKCIFAKTYQEAVEDLEDCIKKYGNNYEMDHTYKFYLALSHLQLNEFKTSEEIFKEDIKEQEERMGEAHFLDLFYYGISKFEQKKWEEAIVVFDKSLAQYEQFSEVKYYKAVCLLNLGKIIESKTLMDEAKNDKKNGYTINEDNSIYEPYPYKVRW